MGKGREGYLSGSNLTRDLRREKRSMQLEVQHYDLPSAIQFNYEEIKAALVEKTHVYETMVYTDDQIKAAKSDRAELNKFKSALNDERIRMEKEYMKPFNEFKDKINELISIVNKPVTAIDSQIKSFEQKKKDEKKEQIAAAFAEMNLPEYITLEKIWNDAWLNSTCSMSRIKEDFKTVAYRDQQAMESIKTLPEYAFEAAEYYKQSLDITAALAKANELARINKAKKEAEQKAAEAVPEVVDEIPASEPVTEVEEDEPFEIPRVWLTFEAYLSKAEAIELASFLKFNKINFRRIEG